MENLIKLESITVLLCGPVEPHNVSQHFSLKPGCLRECVCVFVISRCDIVCVLLQRRATRRSYPILGSEAT